jgi:stage V sporulation protein AE
MEMLMQYVRVFVCGGLFCVVAQILIDKTRITPARILVGYVVAGVFLTAVGLYEPIINFGKSGATVPLTGFGYALAKGVEKAVTEKGMIGALTGGLTATSAGIAAAVLLGSACALVFKSREK